MTTNKLNSMIVSMALALLTSVCVQCLYAEVPTCTTPCASASASASERSCCGCGQNSSQCVSCDEGYNANCEGKNCSEQGTSGSATCVACN